LPIGNEYPVSVAGPWNACPVSKSIHFPGGSTTVAVHDVATGSVRKHAPDAIIDGPSIHWVFGVS
jgi:hypothetical protein